MRKITLLPVFLFIAAVLFCCSTYKSIPDTFEELVATDPASAPADYDLYVRDCNGFYRLKETRVSGDTLYGKAVAETAPAASGQFRLGKPAVDVYTDKSITTGTPNPTGEYAVAIPKKDIKKIAVKKPKGDGDGTGLAIGLIILIVILSALILAGLIWLIAAASANATNSSSNSSGTGSGSNSNSGNSSGNGGGGGGSGSNSGCYVATMVYGSYDAPEVMVLRRFRDETLNRSKAGRAFIRWYYSWSPGFVEKYHHLRWLHRSIKVVLDRLVQFLSR